MISIIIPTFNRGNLIERAIDSVLNQSYTDIEIIVVDDCSTDDTSYVMKKYVNNAKVKYIRLEHNSGACHARNVGISNSSGKLIAFLDSDDEWSIDKLLKQHKYMQQKNAKVVVCNYFYEKNEKCKIAIKKKQDVITYNQLLYENCITTGAILIEKDLIENVGMFDESMPRYQDWELVLRIAKKEKIYFYDEPLLTLHFQKQSISNSTSKEKKFLALEKIYQKNKSELEENKESYAHICWSMGLYSLYSNKKRLDLLKEGVFHAGINLKRLTIYILVKLGFGSFVKKIYSKSH